MSEERELEALQQRLDMAFSASRPRRGFEDELWSRIQVRRSPWARLRETFGRAQLVPVMGGLAGLAVVFVIGGLLLFNAHPAGQTAGSSAQAPVQRGGAAANDGAPSFGVLPRPALRQATQAPTQAATPAVGQRGEYSGPVTVTGVTATVALPASAQVARYPEWRTADADRFAASAGAAPVRDAALPAGALGVYAGSNFTLVVFSTDTAKGSEPRVVMTPKGSQSAGNPADDAAIVKWAHDYLSGYQVPPDPSADGPTVDRRGAQVTVRWNRVLGTGLTAFEVGADGLEEGWEATLNGDLTVFQAAAPAPLAMDFATYGLATAQQLVGMARSAGGTGPQVVLDTAQLVYVVATDGGHGYFEPAVMYTGHFSQGGVQYEKRIIVPAVAPQNLR